MKYIYRMSRRMFFATLKDIQEDHMKLEKYITANFGLRGECVKVEIIG